MSNPYLPLKAEITDIIQETSTDLDIKTFRLRFSDNKPMQFMPGQFVELSVPGIGEAPFGFASSPLVKDSFELTIKRVGLVTNAVHSLAPGDSVWIRGPFGNTFPTDELMGSNIFVVAGGLGLAPLRPLLLYMFDRENRDKYGSIQMLLAARSTGDFIYKRDYDTWRTIDRTGVIQTIDRPEPGWDGRVGFPHTMISEFDLDIRNTHAVLCGPPIMIKLVAASLAELGLPKDRILTTLEMRMTCGVGKCGKCNIGHQYVCVDGPVYSLDQLSNMPDEY